MVGGWVRGTIWKFLLDQLPQGYALAEADWQRRHRLLLWVLALHIPGLAVFGVVLHRPLGGVLIAVVIPAICLAWGRVLRRHRRVASVFVTGGLVYSSAALVGLTGGSIEAHFHFFIIIGFIALYQDWIPFLFNVLFTVISHGVGSAWQQTLIFNHAAGQGNPWLWSLIHGVAVLLACVGLMLFWRVTEESQQEKDALAQRLAESEINRRQFTSDMLVNLARRNQSMLYRQLDIITQLEESEQDPDALAELFRLDHLATRVRRNAESLLVLAGEQPARVWSESVPLRDVARASIAETEELDRVSVLVDQHPAIFGHMVTDVTHLLAELTENAVRFSPPDTLVTVRTRADRRHPGGQILMIEDLGVGMPPQELAAANAILADPPDVDMAVSQRLGIHVVARLSARHGIRVSLTTTPGSGITAVVELPPRLFDPNTRQPMAGAAPVRAPSDLPARRESNAWTAPAAPTGPATATLPRRSAPEDHATGQPRIDLRPFDAGDTWHGWWDPPTELTELTEVDSTAFVPIQRTTASSTDAAHATDPVSGLRLRVPQSHLAPELRRPVHDADARAALPPGYAAEAASALSRYQASRRAALEGEPDDGMGT